MKRSDKSDTRYIFCPEHNAQSDFFLSDCEEFLSKSSPIAEEHTVFNFHVSNVASPFFGKRPTPNGPRSPSSLNSPTPKPKSLAELKQNNPIKKANNSQSFCDPQGIPDKPRASLSVPFEVNDLEPSALFFYQLKDQDVLSQGLFAESTAIASDTRDHRPSEFKHNAVNLLSDEDELEEGLKSCPISFTRLIKMKPLCALMMAYFDGRDCVELLEAIDKDYEFKILNFLFTFLQLRYKSSRNQTLREKLASLLYAQPGRRKKRQKIIQAIFIHVVKLMQSLCAFLADPQIGDSPRTTNFYHYYFHNICPPGRDPEEEFSYAKNTKNGNLAYSFIERAFKSRIFARDFLRILHDRYLESYRHLRMRKLGLLFARWENMFLQSAKEEQALERIRQEATSRHFRLAWTDSELTPFFKFFNDLAK